MSFSARDFEVGTIILNTVLLPLFILEFSTAPNLHCFLITPLPQLVIGLMLPQIIASDPHMSWLMFRGTL